MYFIKLSKRIFSSPLLSHEPPPKSYNNRRTSKTAHLQDHFWYVSIHTEISTETTVFIGIWRR